MSLIVEDGSGLPDAESYASVNTADAYHANFNNAAWTAASTAVKEAALRRATQYLDSRYKFLGYRLHYNQALMWPRSGIWLEGVYLLWPVNRMVQATCELALRALSTTLAQDTPDQVQIENTVGPITVRYSPSNLAGQVRFAVVDDLLRPFVSAGVGSSIRLERA
jgi:hypothetical protein